MIDIAVAPDGLVRRRVDHPGLPSSSVAAWLGT